MKQTHLKEGSVRKGGLKSVPLTPKPNIKSMEQKPLRAANGQLLPGQCPNPNGRPKGSVNHYSIAELWRAIGVVEKRKHKKLLERFAEQAFDEPQLMTSIMKKLLPDLKAIEGLVATFESSMSDELAKSIQDKLKERFG